MSNENQNSNDGLGFAQVKAIVSQLSQLKTNPGTDAQLVSLIHQLVTAVDTTDENLQFLKDRYELLKRSNAALSDELVWLRDQLDDLSVPS